MNNLNDLNNLNNLEYRLWLLQGEVNQALQNVDKASPIDRNRLDHMASEISYLQRQVTAMRELGRENMPSSVQPQPFEQSSSSVQPQPFEQSSSSGQPQSRREPLPQREPLPYGQPQRDPLPYDQPLPQRGPLPYVQPQPQRGPLPYAQPLPQGSPLPSGGPVPYGQPLPSGEPKKDLEKTLGTGIMGIVASILIFISIIIFGGLLLPYLTDVFMTAIMFLLSFILFGAGGLLLRKDLKNKFYISLCACGATAICVSLFVTRLYFELINDIVFLALIVVWLALMAFICKQYQNHIFRIIGETGVFLTACFGMARLIADETADDRWFMYCILLAVFGSSTLIFNYVGRSCEQSSLSHKIIPAGIYEKNAFSHTIRSLAFLLFSVAFMGETGPGMGVYAGFALMSAFLCLEIYMSYGDVLHDGCLFYCLMGINVLTYCAVFCKTFEVESCLPYYITAILLTGLFEVKQSKNSMFGRALACLVFLGGGWAWLHESVFYTLLVMLPLLAYGYVRKNKAALYMGLFSIAAVFTADITVLPAALLWAVPFLCFAALARIMKDQIFTAVGYPVFMACGADVLLQLLEGFDFRYGERTIIVFLILAALHILLMKLKVFAEDGKVFEIVAALMTLCFMIYSACAVYDEYLNVVTMLVMAGLYTMNTVNLLKKSEHFGYYIGFKCTVLMILLVDSHIEISMLLSVLMLLLAAGSIAFGFYKSYKSFRIYGLILSMVSVFKLILFDVSSKSALYNAVGFLACGLICFGISFLYSKIESRLREKGE